MPSSFLRSGTATVLFFGLFGIAFFWLVSRQGWYPAAVVGARPIWAADFRENVRGTRQYYESQGRASQDLKIQKQLATKEALREIERGVLQAMVEDSLIASGTKALGIQNVSQRLQERVGAASQSADSSQDLERGVFLLYGWHFKDFEKRVLLPQARRELVQEEFKKRGENFDAWLLTLKRRAQVSVLAAGLDWQEGNVVAKKQ
ncbi:SurA N-terminal domain-containing protein [Candidatus Azambacteria bacterium]|nr:SurA N-terminal domain-containing protein [Candidatus Azambacteria bacterium]